MVTPHDEERFAQFVREFVEGAGYEPPFQLVAIGSNGTVSVGRCLASCVVEAVCGHNVEAGMMSPITIGILTPDGRGKAATITMQ